MKHNYLKVLLALFSMLFITAACNNDDDDDATVSSCVNVVKGELVAEVDSIPFSSDQAVAFFIETVVEEKGLFVVGIEEIGAAKGTQTMVRGVAMLHPDIKDNTGEFILDSDIFGEYFEGGHGVYFDSLEVDLDSLSDFDYMFDHIVSDDNIHVFTTTNDNTGTIDICEINDGIAGTFEFDASSGNASDSTVVKITNGEFSADAVETTFEEEVFFSTFSADINGNNFSTFDGSVGPATGNNGIRITAGFGELITLTVADYNGQTGTFTSATTIGNYTDGSATYEKTGARVVISKVSGDTIGGNFEFLADKISGIGADSVDVTEGEFELIFFY